MDIHSLLDKRIKPLIEASERRSKEREKVLLDMADKKIVESELFGIRFRAVVSKADTECD